MGRREAPSLPLRSSAPPAEMETPIIGSMTWHPDVMGVVGTNELARRFHTILAQLESGDYATASDAMRNWAEDCDLGGLPEEVLGRIRICIMDARAELIHMEPDVAQSHIRLALSLTAIPA